MPIPAAVLTQMADVLAEIYSDHASARTMATTAGVPVERIPVDDKPLGYWVNILQEAENRGLTEALLDRAAVQYPNNPACDHHNRLWWQTDRSGGWVCETEQVEKGLKLNLAPLAV